MIKSKKKQKSLEDKYKLVIARKDELKGLYSRALADYQNLQRQSTKEKLEFAKYANEQLIHEILPVYDNLKTSVAHFKKGGDESWLQGIKYVIKQFKDVLKQAGLEEIETHGKEFDHNTMEALEGKGKKVEKQVQSGYILAGKVIRPAKVILDN
ncbi:nucleotide exchange factor GrpE [Patescibacteria group bacterium]|nr:nucleotide exchange factor GrpE [Patescibacteria group bacterium]